MNTAELKQACFAKLEQMPEHKLQEALNFLSQQLEQDVVPTQTAANDEIMDWQTKLKEAQQLLKQYIPQDRDLVAELIAERRQAAENE